MEPRGVAAVAVHHQDDWIAPGRVEDCRLDEQVSTLPTVDLDRAHRRSCERCRCRLGNTLARREDRALTFERRDRDRAALAAASPRGEEERERKAGERQAAQLCPERPGARLEEGADRDEGAKHRQNPEDDDAARQAVVPREERGGRRDDERVLQKEVERELV